MARRPMGIVAAALALGITGCATVAKGPPKAARKPPATVWHVGRFTVREVSLPAVATADGFPNLGPYALSGGFTLARVSTSPPYTVSRTNLITHQTTVLGTVSCAQHPYFAQTFGQGTALFCPAAVGAAGNSLFLIDQTGTIRTLDLPVRIPVAADRLQVTAQEFDGYVEWMVLLDSEPSVLYGLGMIDIATGTDGPIPAAVTRPPGYPGANVFVGPQGNLYDVVATEESGTQEAYRWTGPASGWTKLGIVSPGPFPYGTPSASSDGSIWWIRPDMTAGTAAGIAYRWHVIRTVPGSQRDRSWSIHGDMLGVGPGFFAYLPFQNPAELVVDFPLLGKRLTFGNLNTLSGPPYFLSQVAQMGTDWSTLNDTQVIYMGVGTKEKVLLITP